MKSNEIPVPTIIKWLAGIAMLLGTLYGIQLIFRNVFFFRNINNEEVNITAVLLATGLLGGVLQHVVEKIIKDFIDKNYPKIEEDIKNEYEENKILEKEEQDENKIVERGQNSQMNTVIVPVAKTYDEIRSSNEYKCPDTYIFKDGLEYIAFYKDKRIVGYGKIISDYNKSEAGMKIFKIEDFISKNIAHKKKGAFVQNKMYCNFEKLKSAITTDEIRSVGSDKEER